jgi:hypothetical protein
MKRKFGEYVRISRGLFGCSSFWRGENHYLYVRGNGFILPFSEDCFRFEFLKVQSIAVTRTGAAMVYGVLFGLIALGSGLLTVASIVGIDGSPSDGVLIFLAVLLGFTALVSIAVVAVNIVLGPTCVCRIQTSVRTERIRPLSRWGEAQAALKAMMTEVELAQKVFAPVVSSVAAIEPAEPVEAAPVFPDNLLTEE